MTISQIATAHVGHGHQSKSKELSEQSMLGLVGYAFTTAFNVAELFSHLKVLKDFWPKGPTNLADLGVLAWNGAEVYGHSMNALNYGGEIMQWHEEEDHDEHDHRHEETRGYYARLACVNAATTLFQILTFHKYWHKEASPANKAVLFTTAIDFVFHGWDLYYSSSKSMENRS